MVKHHYLTALLIWVTSVLSTAVNSQTPVSQPPAKQAQKPEKTPEDPLLASADKEDTSAKSKQEQQTVKATEQQQETFTPTEEISEDLAVSFPVDI